MFNETSYLGAIPTCKQGEFLVDVGGDNPVCLTQAEYTAFQQSDTSGKAVNVTPKPGDAWTNWIIYGGIALLVFAMIGRR